MMNASHRISLLLSEWGKGDENALACDQLARGAQQLDAIRNATTKEELDALVFGAQSGN